MWADGATEDETSVPGSGGSVRDYVEMLRDMRQLGLQSLNLDVRNLQCYPSTGKLYHQLQFYPHEIIPLMDQCVKDVIVDQAEEDMNRLRADERTRGASSSMPPVPR